MKHLLRTLTALVFLVLAADAARAQQDFSAVQIKATKIGGNLYALEGQGGVIGALVGPDGVFTRISDLPVVAYPPDQ